MLDGFRVRIFLGKCVLYYAFFGSYIYYFSIWFLINKKILQVKQICHGRCWCLLKFGQIFCMQYLIHTFYQSGYKIPSHQAPLWPQKLTVYPHKLMSTTLHCSKYVPHHFKSALVETMILI